MLANGNNKRNMFMIITYYCRFFNQRTINECAYDLIFNI